MSVETFGSGAAAASSGAVGARAAALESSPGPMSLSLTVRDAEVAAELARHPAGAAREGYALSALRVGVLAIRQASGVIDAAAIREEGQRLIAEVGTVLQTRSADLNKQLSGLVAQYFDPKTGVLEQRLSSLVRQDGELDRLIRRHLDADTSTIAQTLARHVGQQSPIFRLLSPDQKEGLVSALAGTLDAALKDQHQRIRQEFSLDQESSALSRLLKQITDANGRLRDDLKNNVDVLCGEFSLDNEDGALKRLVNQVERAQRCITSEFDLNNADSALMRLSKLLESTQATLSGSLTLDDDASPLSRMQNKLLEVLNEAAKRNSEFQSDMRAALEAMQARRQEADRSTRHGGVFEDAVGEFLRQEAQRLGDLLDAVGETVGLKPRCKVGDHVITLGPESAAPGERIVFEAKEDQSYRESNALAEIEEACENRGAQVGVFVFSKRIAPAGTESLRRIGRHILVVWDREDTLSDAYLKAAVSLARLVVVRKATLDRQTQEELAQMEQTVFRISRDAERISKLRPMAETARKSSEQIRDELAVISEDLEKQLERLRECVRALRPAADSAAA